MVPMRVDFIVSWTGLRDAKLAGKTSFLGVSERVFGKRLAFEWVN